MECRGEERRKWIVSHYNVIPVAHIQLLKGQVKHSDAGAKIENDYYIFEAVDKNTNEKSVIQCGMRAASHFLKLLEVSGLPLFNPLHYGDHVCGGGDNNRYNTTIHWNPVARQLYNAIMWVIIMIDAKPHTPIFEIKEKVYEFRYKEPLKYQVKSVNTIIEKSMGGTLLSEKIDELRVENDIRDELCQFEKLVNIIDEYTDKEGKKIDIKSFF